MTEECNCLPLKYIFNSSTENLLEHFVFVQVITKFGQNPKCCGELVNISEALEPVVSDMPWDLNVVIDCLFLHMDTACLYLWDTLDIENMIVMFIYYS